MSDRSSYGWKQNLIQVHRFWNSTGSNRPSRKSLHHLPIELSVFGNLSLIRLGQSPANHKGRQINHPAKSDSLFKRSQKFPDRKIVIAFSPVGRSWAAGGNCRQGPFSFELRSLSAVSKTILQDKSSHCFRSAGQLYQ